MLRRASPLSTNGPSQGPRFVLSSSESTPFETGISSSDWKQTGCTPEGVAHPTYHPYPSDPASAEASFCKPCKAHASKPWPTIQLQHLRSAESPLAAQSRRTLHLVNINCSRQAMCRPQLFVQSAQVLSVRFAQYVLLDPSWKPHLASIRLVSLPMPCQVVLRWGHCWCCFPCWLCMIRSNRACGYPCIASLSQTKILQRNACKTQKNTEWSAGAKQPGTTDCQPPASTLQCWSTVANHQQACTCKTVACSWALNES